MHQHHCNYSPEALTQGYFRDPDRGAKCPYNDTAPNDTGLLVEEPLAESCSPPTYRSRSGSCSQSRSRSRFRSYSRSPQRPPPVHSTYRTTRRTFALEIDKDWRPRNALFTVGVSRQKYDLQPCIIHSHPGGAVRSVVHPPRLAMSWKMVVVAVVIVIVGLVVALVVVLVVVKK